MTENKKYELTNETKEWCGCTLHRIRALKDFGAVKFGELGGWVESEHNLSQDGDCWIYDDATVYDNATVCGNAAVCDNATVGGRATVYGEASIYDNAAVCGNAAVCDNATVRDCSIVCDSATIGGHARVYGKARVCGEATVCEYARVCGYARVGGYASILRNADYTVVQGFGREQRVTTFYRLKDGDIGVACGCFHGTIKQFRDKVKETHGKSKYAKEYLMIADLMELHFGEEQ